MAIDMTTVKAISYNNKDVVKIEDSLGHVLWQAGTPPTPIDEPIFVSANGQLRLENNTFYSNPWSGTNAIYGNCVGSDGTDIYSQTSNTESTTGGYKLDSSTSTGSSFRPNRAISGNSIGSDYNGNIYSSYGSTQLKLDKTTGKGSIIAGTSTGTIVEGSLYRGSGIIKANNKIYSMNNSGLFEVDPTNLTVTKITTTNWPSKAYGYNVGTDGTNYYYSKDSGNHYVLDFNNGSATAITGNGTNNFLGCRVIKYNNKIICQESGSDNYYELNIATRTWSPYTFSFDSGVNNIRNSFDKLWNADGRWSGGCSCSAITIKD